jgi:probable HAF family extracellular repeat protein
MRNEGIPLSAVLLFAGTLTLTPAAHAQVATSAINIGGPVPGSTSVAAIDINDSGTVATRVGGPLPLAAQTWHPLSGWRNIGVLGDWIMPTDINNRGQVVGLNGAVGQSYNGGVIWDAAGGWRTMHGFETAYNGGPASVTPAAINDLGRVVGTSWAGPFVWDDVDGPTWLNPDWAPADINNAGQIAGDNTATGLPFLWDPLRGEIAIDTLAGGPTSITDINERGQIVGASYLPDRGYHAFFWDPKTGITDLGVIGGYDDEFCECRVEHSWAYGLNDLGQVVGQTSFADGSYGAFIWEAKKGMRRLLAANTTFTDAIPMSINNFGQIVGGFITATGDAGGFYAKVPLPKQTPTERTEAVIESVARLVTTAALRRTDAATITAPLDAAVHALDGGSERTARNHLRLAVSAIDVLVRFRRLPAADGRALTDVLDAIIDEL